MSHILDPTSKWERKILLTFEEKNNEDYRYFQINFQTNAGVYIYIYIYILFQYTNRNGHQNGFYNIDKNPQLLTIR